PFPSPTRFRSGVLAERERPQRRGGAERKADRDGRAALARVQADAVGELPDQPQAVTGLDPPRRRVRRVLASAVARARLAALVGDLAMQGMTVPPDSQLAGSAAVPHDVGG